MMRTVEKNGIGYWLKKNGEGTALMEDTGRYLHFQCEPARPDKKDQRLSINKEDLLVFLRALGWTVEIPEGE